MAFGQYMGIIGTVVGAVIGGVIGSYFPGVGTYAGASIGGARGGAVGGVAGQVFFPEKADINLPPPPQPHETRQQISTYGAAIPIQYGSGRMSGNIVRMSPVVETITRSKHRQDGVRYYEMVKTYTATFAMCFCEGPVPGVARIWVNGKIFADFRDPNGPYYPSGSTALASANLDTSIARSETFFSIYLGSETQTADAELVAKFGAATVPAYRGRCYIVFIDFPVGEYSGIPNIEIEVTELIELTSWADVDWSGWTELDFNNVTELPATFMAVTADTVQLTAAGDWALTKLSTVPSPALGPCEFRLAINATALGGSSGSQRIKVLEVKDSVGSHRVTVSLYVSHSAIDIELDGETWSDEASYAFALPFARWLRLTFPGASHAQLLIYSDAGYATLEDTLDVYSTIQPATPSFNYVAVGELDGEAHDPLTITISDLQTYETS